MRRVLCATSLLCLALLLLSGCASDRGYYASAPPPPPYAYRGQPPLIEMARREGFRAGEADGARDAYERRRPRPEHDRNFHDTPGYDPAMGPYKPYRDTFRDAYVHGYANGFGRG